MYEEYIEELEDKVEELEDKNLNNKAWKDFYADENIKLRKENTQSQNNWNKLKKWLEEEIEEQEKIWRQREIIYSYQNVLNEMQELEQGKDE